MQYEHYLPFARDTRDALVNFGDSFFFDKLIGQSRSIKTPR